MLKNKTAEKNSIKTRAEYFNCEVDSTDADIGCIILLRFSATLTARVISWRSVTHMCFLAFSNQY